MAGRTRNKPHTQIGQKGKGKNQPKKQPPYKTQGLPFQAGEIPKAPPQIPNFLPSTPSFVRGQSTINDQLSLAGSQYGMRTSMIDPQLKLQQARLDTDEGVARSRLDEDLAERGVYTSGFRPTLYQRHITTPFGRQRQDLASDAASQWADAGLQYGQDQLGASQNMMNLYNDTAQETASQPYLGFGYGGYDLPNQPGPYLSSSGGGQRTGGKTRPNKNRNRNGRR